MPYENKKQPKEGNNEALALKNLEEKNLLIQNSEVAEIDQLIFNIESSFCKPDEVDTDTKTESAMDTEGEYKELNIENIFLLQKGGSNEDINSEEIMEYNILPSEIKKI